MQSYESRYANERRSARIGLGSGRSFTITPGWLIFALGFIVGAWLL